MTHHFLGAWRFCTALLLAALSGASFAAERPFPTKPIRWLVPFAPGGVGDLTARVVAQKMSSNMGQQVVVDNRPGAGMIMSATAALQAAPDGYTIIQAGNGTAISASLFKSLPYDILKDFTQISTLADFDLVVVTSADSKLASVADIVAFAKKNPGKVNIATISIGATQHLAAELFISMAGIDAQTVPFKATPAVITAVRAKDVPLAFEILPGVIGPLKGGILRAIAVAPARRSPVVPDTPTIAESGVAGYQAASWTGLSTHAKTPPAIVQRLHQEVAAAVNAPEVKQKLLEMGATAQASASPEEARKLMIAEIAKWKAVIERAKIERQ
jgi:tripartite-type tricarboxylate transporter receptor subunit TctC